MPIVVIHASAADQLGPAANAGQYSTDRTNFEASLQQADFQAQQQRWQDELQQRASDAAQQRALLAAQEVDRRRTAQEQDQTRRDIAGQTTATQVETTKLKNQGALDVAGVNAQTKATLASQTAQDRLDLADHTSTLRQQEQAAAQQGRYQDAAALQQQRLKSEQDLAASRQQFQAKTQAIAQDFSARQQDQRLRTARDNAANRYEFDRQKTVREQKLKGLNEQIQQLQHQAAVAPDNQSAGAIEKQIETLMQQYKSATDEYDAWLNAPPALPPRGGAAATTQAANTGGATTPQVSNQDDYNALPSGAVYLDPQGRRRQKR